MLFSKLVSYSKIGAIALAMSCLPACGGDDDDSTGNGNTGGTSTTGNGTGGSTTTGNAAGASGIGDLINSFFRDASITSNCSETAPASLSCGGTACKPFSTTLLWTAPCVHLCCAKDKSGAEVCGAKDTSKDAPEPCQVEPVADSRCPDYTVDDTGSTTRGTAGTSGQSSRDGGTTTVKGCCNSQNQCGIVSTVRPLCVIKSSLIDLPATPQACQ
jgi:hypothetical protein